MELLLIGLGLAFLANKNSASAASKPPVGAQDQVPGMMGGIAGGIVAGAEQAGKDTFQLVGGTMAVLWQQAEAFTTPPEPPTPEEDARTESQKQADALAQQAWNDSQAALNNANNTVVAGAQGVDHVVANWLGGMVRR